MVLYLDYQNCLTKESQIELSKKLQELRLLNVYTIDLLKKHKLDTPCIYNQFSAWIHGRIPNCRRLGKFTDMLLSEGIISRIERIKSRPSLFRESSSTASR